MPREGAEVRWLPSFLLSPVSQTHCYFEGLSLKAAEEPNRYVGVRFEQSVEVAEMTRESV